MVVVRVGDVLKHVSCFLNTFIFQFKYYISLTLSLLRFSDKKWDVLKTPSGANLHFYQLPAVQIKLNVANENTSVVLWLNA